MAKCKYCGENISRLDNNICPFCGGKNPLDGSDTSTQDVTKVLGQYIDPSKIKNRSKILAAIFAIFLGVLGVHSLYLGKKKNFLIDLSITVIFVGMIGTLLFFVMGNNFWGYLIPLFVEEILMIIVGISFLTRSDITDVNGQFLK